MTVTLVLPGRRLTDNRAEVRVGYRDPRSGAGWPLRCWHKPRRAEHRRCASGSGTPTPGRCGPHPASTRTAVGTATSTVTARRFRLATTWARLTTRAMCRMSRIPQRLDRLVIQHNEPAHAADTARASATRAPRQGWRPGASQRSPQPPGAAAPASPPADDRRALPPRRQDHRGRGAPADAAHSGHRERPASPPPPASPAARHSSARSPISRTRSARSALLADAKSSVGALAGRACARAASPRTGPRADGASSCSGPW